MKKINRTFQRSASSLDEAKRQITFVASTGAPDRYSDIVEPLGCDYSAYMQNPVVLFAHDASELPIGKTVSITKTAKAVECTVQFATADQNPIAENVWKLYKGGYMNAVSIGFRPLEMEMLMEDGQPTGMRFITWELLELSCVPIPANPEALAKTARLLGAKGFQPYAEDLPKHQIDPDVVALLKAIQVKPANKTIDKDVADFVMQLFAESAKPGSVREFLHKNARR
ncbi:MAG TPA: HK97 family phage prohead protease [Candidatus Solibacter sp.]|nr:HK97 family phage prohead protease [Candidatus Solibacter sp.]